MRRIFVIALFAACGLVSGSCSILSLVNWNEQQLLNATMKTVSAAALSDAEIQQLSKQSVAQLDSKAVIENGEYTARLSRLLGNLGPIDGRNFEFKVYKTNEVNAFALADGSIRVYSGLMDVMSDNEIVAIVGHEIGHVVHQDSKSAMKKAYMASAARDLVGAAGTLGALSSAVLGDLSEAFVNAQFSQKQEFKADEYGFKFSLDCGCDPYSMSNALEKLVSLSKGSQSSSVAKMFSSHPDSEIRAAKMKEMAENYKAKK